MSCSRSSPASIPRMPTRGLSRVRSTRPLFAMSCSFRPPGTRATTRSFPARFTAYNERLAPGLRRREPDLVAGRRPREAVLARPLARERRLLSREIDDGDRAGVVQREGVIEKRDAVAFRREARVADVAGGLIQDLAHRVLDAGLAVHVPHDQERFAVGGPVRLLNPLRDAARRPSRQRRASERAAADARVIRPAVERDRHLPVGEIPRRFELGSSSGSESGLEGCFKKSFSGLPSHATL